MQKGDHEMDETKREMSDVLKDVHKDGLKEIKNIGILVREGGRKEGKTAVAE